MSLKAGTTFAEFVRQRGVVHELNPEVAHAAIQGYQDEIAPAALADAAFYRQFKCPTCHGGLLKEFLGGVHGIGTTWVPGEVTPQALLRCTSCRLLMNPRSGLIVEKGDMLRVIPVDEDRIGVRR